MDGYVHLLYGAPACGKTQLALAWALYVMDQGRAVLFIDEESGDNVIAGRMEHFGADPDMLDELMHYYSFPHVRLTDMPALEQEVARVKPALVIFDALADVLGASNIEENDNGNVTKWMTGMAVPLARQYGATVLLLDHQSKDAASNTYSRGAGAKKSKTDFAWHCEKTSDFDHQTVGRLKLTRQKNRLGVLPHEVEYLAGPLNGSRLAVVPAVEIPPKAEREPAELSPIEVQIFEAVASGLETGAAIAAHLGMSPRTVTEWLGRIHAKGIIEVTGERRWQRWMVAR